MIMKLVRGERLLSCNVLCNTVSNNNEKECTEKECTEKTDLNMCKQNKKSWATI